MTLSSPRTLSTPKNNPEKQGRSIIGANMLFLNSCTEASIAQEIKTQLVNLKSILDRNSGCSFFFAFPSFICFMILKMTLSIWASVTYLGKWSTCTHHTPVSKGILGKLIGNFTSFIFQSLGKNRVLQIIT
jgi:hypothetical protein